MEPEAWLLGSVPDVDPVISHLLRASQQIREDAEAAVGRLTPVQIWTRPEMMNPVGFHLKHLAGSTLRLLTYLEGGALSPQKLAGIPLEKYGEEDAGDLLAAVNAAFDRYDEVVRALEPARFSDIREVGRVRIPVTAISLAIHITEHGHRHVGQIVSASAFARAHSVVKRAEALDAELRSLGEPTVVEGRARFGIRPGLSVGVSVPKLRAVARKISHDQALAEELWATQLHEARLLAAYIADPAKITSSTMDHWAQDFNSWDLCDSCACEVFDKTPFAWQKIFEWAQSEAEFIRRAAFSTIAGIAVHDKRADDASFLAALPLIEHYAFDDRNLVRKAVNWALRSIGKRNPVLCEAAIACAQRLQQQGTRSARWIASDALRELRSR